MGANPLDRLLDYVHDRLEAGCRWTATALLLIGSACLLVGALIDGPVG